MRNVLVILCIFSVGIASAQSTIGLIDYQNETLEGYVLFSGVASKETYLIDKCGNKVKQWSSNYKPGLSYELLTNGDLFRTGLSSSSSFGSGGGKGGILERFDWDGNLEWSYQISDADQCQHHDAYVLPNGNVIAIVWARKTDVQATQAGKNPSVTAVLNNQEVWSEKLVEIQPTGTNGGTIVWEWNAWDHLVQDFDNSKDNFDVVSDRPELLNVNYVLQGPPTNPDWLHLNSIDYNPVTDELILSSHSFGEFWIIDHSTTTLEAASHSGGNSGKGGDLLYRWGNPITYDRGTSNDQKLFKQHHATFIKPGYPNAGKVLVFNNGVDRPGGNYSSIDMIDIAQAGYPYSISANSAYLPASEFWSYSDPNPSSFYATNISGVYPLINGSFLVTNGPKGEFFEIDSLSNLKWKYINPVNNVGPMNQGTLPSANTVFRANFYPPNYAGFSGQTLTSGAEIELNPTVPSLCSISYVDENDTFLDFLLYPNPIRSSDLLSVQLESMDRVEINIMDTYGRIVLHETNSTNLELKMNISALKKGVYFVQVRSGEENRSEKLIIQ